MIVPSISTSISKLGKHIPCISFPVGETCRENAPCFDKCYARAGRFNNPSVQKAYRRNLEIWHNDPEFFELYLKNFASNYRFFRYHSSGDIPDAEYLKMMFRVAEALPGTNFLCFTKKFEMVNDYLDEHEQPDNLQMFLSQWACWKPENPHNLPIAAIKLRCHESFIPEDAIHCPGFCGDCVLTGCSCWHMKHGQTVFFDEHSTKKEECER